MVMCAPIAGTKRERRNGQSAGRIGRLTWICPKDSMTGNKDKYVSTAMQLEAVQKENERLKWENERLRDHWAAEKAKAEVYKQLDDTNKALLHEIVAAVGGTEDKPLRVRMDDVLEARKRGLEVRADVDQATGECLLYQ